jgi:NADPH-dependent glutamate synthase beta subunit-like oxidoreductase
LDAELERLRGIGIAFSEGVDVGSASSLEELRASFDAVFLALGAQGSRELDIPGLGGVKVSSGLDFLKSVNGLGPSSVSGKVAVLGGGNTAIDVARTVKRLGGEPVICSPEEIEEMPALATEVAYTQAENIPILGGVTFGRVEAGTFTFEVGRKARKLEVNQVIVAIGEEVETDWLPEEMVENGSVAAGLMGATPLEGVFAGGDCTAGERTVARAIGNGRRGAMALDVYLSRRSPSQAETSEDLVGPEDLNLDYCPPAPAAVVPETPLAERMTDLSVEVRLDLEPAVAQEEASRCFGCGSCTTCCNCLVFCPDLAVVRFENERGLSILYEYCKGCGICVTECPSGVLGLERETEGA